MRMDPMDPYSVPPRWWWLPWLHTLTPKWLWLPWIHNITPSMMMAPMDPPNIYLLSDDVSLITNRRWRGNFICTKVRLDCLEDYFWLHMRRYRIRRYITTLAPSLAQPWATKFFLPPFQWYPQVDGITLVKSTPFFFPWIQTATYTATDTDIELQL